MFPTNCQPEANKDCGKEKMTTRFSKKLIFWSSHSRDLYENKKKRSLLYKLKAKHY